MLTKELETLKLIEELYHGDTTEQDMLDFAEKNQTKIQTWKEAFEEYPLYEITKAINHFYVKKSSKTRPNIAQIMAILEENNAEKEHKAEVFEKPEITFGMKFLEEDKENGDMHWFVPDYMTVERLILADKWGWIYNIKKPTKDEFHRAIEEWCTELTGYKYRFYSDNDIENMTEEQRQALWEKCHKIINGFDIKKLN